MKLIRLTLDRLVVDVHKNTLTAVLFIIGTVLSTIMITYIWGNYMPSKVSFATQNLAYRQLKVDLFNSQPLTIEDLHILDQYGISEVVVSIVTSPHSPDQPETTLSACRDNNVSKVLSSVLFEDSQLSENNIIVPNSSDDSQNITISGIEYTIVKKLANTSSNVCYIPIESIIKNNLEINRITYILASIPNYAAIPKLRNILYTHFNQIMIEDAGNYKASDDSKSISVIIMIIVSCFISMLSYVFLFNYIIETDKISYVTYIIAGGSRAQIILSMMMEMLFLSLDSSCLAVILHALLYKPVFSSINLYKNISYNLTDYVIVAVICVVLSVLSALPYILKFSHSTIINLKRETIG